MLTFADLPRLLDPLGLEPRTAFDGLTALICLRTISREPLSALSHGELLALADEADPLDRSVRSEVRALTTHQAGVLAQSCDAALLGPGRGTVAVPGSAAAVAELLVGRARAAGVLEREPEPARGLGRVVREGAVAVAGLVRERGPGARVVVLDPAPGVGDLVCAVHDALPLGLAVCWTLPGAGAPRGGGTPGTRLARRRLVSRRAIVGDGPPGAPVVVLREYDAV
jgi:hypothetical protein